MFSVAKKYVLTVAVCLLGIGQGFGADELKCAANTQWGGFTTEIASKPDGSDYYEIDTPEKLAWFACEVSKYTTESVKLNAKLMQSINMEGKLFIPISAGKGTPSFGGIFDGRGFSIKNLFIDASEIAKSSNGGNKNYVQNVGLFATLNGGTVQNLSLENVIIYAASSAGDDGTQGKENPISVGTVVGFMKAGTIDGCAVSGKIETSGSTNRVGGIAGNVWSATISNSISEVNIFATGNDTHVGGIVGALRNEKGKSELPVEISSCVYAGETLRSNNGSVGAIAGNYEKAGIVTVNNKKDTTVTTSNLYYTADYPAVGTGLANKPFADTNKVESLNTEDVICELNGGSWDMENNTCSGASADGDWSEGQDNISMNGSDGFKVSFDPNGGVFPEGAQTFKFFAKGATITANEIENPTFVGNKFAGWSLTRGGEVQDLGIADKAKTVYAVWKPIRTITFNATPGSFEGSSSVTSKLVAEGDVVTVEGLPALPVRFCSQGAEPQCDKYAYFNGWSTQLHAPYGEKETIPEGTIIDLPTFKFESDTTLYAVWIESVTYTVTFNANGHGQTKVAFVKVGKGDKTVQPPDPNPDDGYVFTNRWCLETTSCDENTKFDFDDTEIDTSIVLYADWNVPNYDIVYNIDGEPNTTTGNPAEYNVESSSITLVKPTREGFKFDGWYDEDGNEATTILKGSTGNKEFHASWIPITYSIVYLSGYTWSLTTGNDVKAYDVPKKLKDGVFAHSGCNQDGWSKADYGEEGYNIDFALGAFYEDNKDTILYPHWNCGTFEIIYELNGGSQPNPANPSSYTGPAPVALTNPVKKGYDSEGWYAESNFKNKIVKIHNVGATTTYYAKWKIHEYKITYNLNGGTNNANNPSKYTVESEFAFAAPTKVGFKFIGWYGKNDFSGEKINGIEIGSTGDKKLYAKWAAYPITTTYGAVTITEESENYATAEIEGAYTGDKTVEITENISVNSVTLNRSFTQNVLSSIMLPFSISASKIIGATKIYKFNRVAQSDGIWKVKVGVVTNLEANTPYMVLPSANGQLTFNLDEPVNFNTTTGPETKSVVNGTWEFVGVYAYTYFGADFPDVDRVYGFAAEEANGFKPGDFVKAGIGADIPAMRAYLIHHRSSTPAYARALTKSATGFNHSSVLPDVIEIEVEDEDGTTLVRGKLNTRTGEVRMDSWFDMKGRKLNTRPTSPGNYYLNGKHVIVK